MESESRFRKNVPTNNNLPEKPNEKSDRDLRSEIFWPLISLTLGIRPLHMWDVGRKAHLQEGQKVLELAAGYPSWKIYSRRVGKTGIFIASDINETINKRSKKLISLNLGRQNASEQIVTADADNLPFSDESMDIIIANNLPEEENTYSEAFRVLKPKGRLISTCTQATWATDITNILKEVGFTNVQKTRGTPFGLLFTRNWFITGSKPSLQDSP